MAFSNEDLGSTLTTAIFDRLQDLTNVLLSELMLTKNIPDRNRAIERFKNGIASLDEAREVIGEIMKTLSGGKNDKQAS